MQQAVSRIGSGGRWHIIQLNETRLFYCVAVGMAKSNHALWKPVDRTIRILALLEQELKSDVCASW